MGIRGVFFPLPKAAGQHQKSCCRQGGKAADDSIHIGHIIGIEGAVLSGERLHPTLYIIGTTKLRQNAHIVLSRPSVRKAPEPRLLYAGKAPPHDMRGDFGIASEGDSETASLSPRLYLDGV